MERSNFNHIFDFIAVLVNVRAMLSKRTQCTERTKNGAEPSHPSLAAPSPTAIECVGDRRRMPPHRHERHSTAKSMSAKYSPFLHAFAFSSLHCLANLHSNKKRRATMTTRGKKYVLIVRTEFLFESYLTSEMNFPLFHARKTLYTELPKYSLHDSFDLFAVVGRICCCCCCPCSQWGSCRAKFCSRSPSVDYRRCTGWRICVARGDASQIHIDDVTKFRNVRIVGVDNVLEIPSSTQKKIQIYCVRTWAATGSMGQVFGRRIARRAKAHTKSRNKLIRMQFEKIVRYIRANNCDTLCG